MYERFIKGNIVKFNPSKGNEYSSQSIGRELNTLFAECAGVSINNGLYRIHSYSSSEYWSDILQRFFAQIKKPVLPFGYDWLGRQYAVVNGIDNVLLMFDPSTIECYQISGNVVDFHNTDLVTDREETVSESSFNGALEKIKASELYVDQCIGYKVPLFLGGSDDASNYEISDMRVYWDIQYQIFEQIKNLPPGTKIDAIKFMPGK